MKKSWYATREGLLAPLVLYFIAEILLGAGNMFEPANANVALLLLALKYCGALIKAVFPIFLTINVIGKKHQDSVPIIAGVMSYVLLHIVTMFVADQDLPSHYYSGFSIGAYNLVAGINRLPLNLGVMASILVILMVIWLYKLSRQRFNYGLMRFIDNDSWFIILTIICTIAMGIFVSMTYPYFVLAFDLLLKFISDNSSNPAVLFIYGIVERVMELLGLENIIRSSFWFGSLGGNWATIGETIFGDVNIWTAQLAANSVQAGVGKYITPYYVINMAIVPAIMFGIYCQYSNKIDRRKMFALLVLGVATSLLSGNLLPLEYLLIIISPALMIMNLILSSSLYGVFMVVGLWLGYDYSGMAAYATAGTLRAFINIVKYMSRGSIINFSMVAGIYFVLSTILVWSYYLVLAQDFLDPKGKLRNRKEMIKALGGIHNLNVIDCTPFSLKVAVYDESKVDEDRIMELGASKIRETYFYLDIEFGPGSVSLYRQIKREMKEYKKCLKYIEAA